MLNRGGGIMHKSHASQVIIDQEPEVTHRKPVARTALVIREDAPSNQAAPNQVNTPAADNGLWWKNEQRRASGEWDTPAKPPRNWESNRLDDRCIMFDY